MFKLESYISPLLMGYLDHYVKLRPEDFQLSLWGGDAVLYNLDLRLDVLERALQLPIVFKSGHIHELRLHVPWTKLGSEPIVITINTVECILKVRDTVYDENESTSSSSSNSLTTGMGKPQRRLKSKASEELPPGYLQSIMNRVVNNVTFIVNNLILKFVEDDIVLTVNIKSAECYSCDATWKRAFVDITPTDLVLRKSINFSDFTVCLDKSSPDGRIDTYQEPMLYRCFLRCRLHMTYDSLTTRLPSITQFNVFCDTFDWSLTDTQLPMFIRLIQLCLCLYYGYLDFTPDSSTKDVKAQTLKSHMSSSENDSSNDGVEDDEEEQGWAAWMWSWVPPIISEEDEELSGPSILPKPSVLSLGFYIHQASVTFKLTEQVRESSKRFCGRKLIFHPFLILRAGGLASEILMQGSTFFNVQCGITYFKLLSAGPCLCGHKDLENSESSTLLKSGNESVEKDMMYDAGSLFDQRCYENQSHPAEFILDGNKHLEVFTESYSLQRFGAFWFDYLSTLVLHDEAGRTSDHISQEAPLFQRENSTYHFVFGPFHLYFTSSLMHRFQKFLYCAQDHCYEPYKSDKTKDDRSVRVSVSESQIEVMEDFLPTCSYHLTLLKPCLIVSAADHQYCNIPVKVYNTGHNKKQKETDEVMGHGGMPNIIVSAQRFDMQLVTPMYASKLARLVSNIAGPSSNLLYHCHTHTHLKLFGLQAGLERPAHTGSKCRPVIFLPTSSLACYFRTLILPDIWKSSYMPVREHTYEVPQIVLTFSKASIMAFMEIVSTWTNPQSPPSLSHNSLFYDLFPETGEDLFPLSVMELSILGSELHTCSTSLVKAYTGSVSSLQVVFYLPGSGEVPSRVLPFIYGPIDSNYVANKSLFLSGVGSSMLDKLECVAFTLQTPCHTSITEAPAIVAVSVQGLACCLDPGLLEWFTYIPSQKTAANVFTTHVPSTAVDMPLAQATSPLQVKGSFMSVRSGSSQTQPTTSRLLSQSKTPQQTPIHAKTKSDDTIGAMKNFLITVFPLLRMMQVQVDIKGSCILIPKTTVVLPEASVDILANIQTAWMSGLLEEVLVICVPSIGVRSSSAHPMAVLQDIPITTVNDSLLGEKLPWTVQLGDWSVYTLHAGRECQQLLEGMSITCTLGASAQYNPPTSDNIQALALCVHIDISPPIFAISPPQVSLSGTILATGGDLLSNSYQVYLLCTSKLLIPSVQPPLGSDVHFTETSSSGLHHPEQSVTAGHTETVEAITTDLSEELSQEISPLYTMTNASSKATDSSLKLSTWLQLVLPRCTISLCLGKQSDTQVKMVLEEFAVSCDVQQVYHKVKITLGSISINNYVHKPSGWIIDQDGPVIVSTLKELPEDLDIVSNKLWNCEKQSTRSAFHSQDLHTGEKAHGFLSVTYTRALCSNVRKKLRNLNVDVTSTYESDVDDSTQTYDLYFHEFLSEVCLKMEPVDFVIHFPTLKNILNLCKMNEHSTFLSECSYKKTSKSAPVNLAQEKDPALSRMGSNKMPLLYAEIGAIRVFIPPDIHSVNSDEGVSSFKTTLAHDFVLLQVASVHLQPHADNPLPRYAVDRDLFQRALQTGILQQTGACIEDRQYQLKLCSLSLASGTWVCMLQGWKHKERHLTPATPNVQIPALEWNNDMGQRLKTEDIQLFPVAMAFDVCLVVAPPVIYKHHLEDQQVLVCGLTAELNMTSDLDLYLSTQQLYLLTKIVTSFMALNVTNTKATAIPVTLPTSAFPHWTPGDSGVESDISSTINQNILQNVPSFKQWEVPMDVLLTAGRISLTVYSHILHGSHPLTTSSCQHGVDGAESVQKNASYRADNFAQLTKGMLNAENSNILTEKTYSSFNLINPLAKEKCPDSSISAGDLCVQPFAYIYISQPHAMVKNRFDSDLVEVSCYDILVKGSGSTLLFSVTENRLMPSPSDFNEYWIETKAGQPNIKTGIPPSLLTLRLSSLFQLPASLEMVVERPMQIHASQNAQEQISAFMQHLSQSPSFLQPDATESTTAFVSSQTAIKDCKSTSSHLALITGVLCVIEQMDIRTKQVVVSIETRTQNSSAGIVAATNSITLTMARNKKLDVSLVAHLEFVLKDVLLKTVYNKVPHVLAGPASLELTGSLRYPCSGLAQGMPQAVLSVQTGLLMLNIGQENVSCLQQFALIIRKTHEKTDQMPCLPTTEVKENSLDGRQSLPLFIHSTTLDDLRSGQFSYKHSDYDGDLPEAGEIVFTEAGVSSTMTWSYREPRVLATVTVLPVPFTLHRLPTGHVQQATVACLLQYWDECSQGFVTYAEFELSESDNSIVKLPEIKDSNKDALVASHIWRVVLCHNADNMEQLTAQNSTESNCKDTGNNLILVTSLAASMCVDSSYVPSLVPNLQVSVSLASLQVLLTHHLSNDAEIPSKLKPYTMTPSLPSDQQWASLTLDNIFILSSHIMGTSSCTAIEVAGQGGLRMLDFNSLDMQTVIPPVDLHLNVVMQHHRQPSVTEMLIRLGKLHILVGKSMMHTLNTSIQAWKMFADGNRKSIAMFAHIIICNNTQKTLRFGQVGTNENIALQPCHMFPYSWRSYQSKQELHLCLDQPSWRWCAPFSVESDGHIVQTVQARDQHYTLIIKTRRLSPIHLQVIVSGQLIVSNQTTQPLELQLKMRHSHNNGLEDELVAFVDTRTVLSSYIVEHSDIVCINVRLSGHNLPWSQIVLPNGNISRDNQLLKVFLPDGMSYIHLWCRMFTQQYGKAQQKLIMLLPLFVLRSHLPHPLQITMETQVKNQLQQLEVKGRGQEFQLHCGGDITHYLSFQLSPKLPASSPPVELSSSLMQQILQSEQATVDIDTLCEDSSHTDLAVQWPYTSCHSPMSNEDRSTQLEQASVDLNIHMSQYKPGCNTVLVNIAPWCLLTNTCHFSLLLITPEHQWQLPSRQTIAPPTLQELVFGCVQEGELCQTASVPLSNDSVEMHRYDPDLGRVLFLDGVIHVQMLMPPAVPDGPPQLLPLSVTSTIVHGIRVLLVSERFCISNMTGFDLDAELMAVHQTSSKLQKSDFCFARTNLPACNSNNTFNGTAPSLKWHLIGNVNTDYLGDLIFYITLKLVDTEATSCIPPNGDDSFKWSVPVRIWSKLGGMRSTVSVPICQRGVPSSEAVCITSQMQDGVMYIVLGIDSAPMCLIYNHCPFSLAYGQAFVNTSHQGLVVQEEAEVLEAVPILASGGHSYYTMPQANVSFPLLEKGPLPCLHVCSVSQTHQMGQQVATQVLQKSAWSAGINLNSGNTFLQIPGVGDIKVSVKLVSMVYHITFSLVNKAEMVLKKTHATKVIKELNVAETAVEVNEATGSVENKKISFILPEISTKVVSEKQTVQPAVMAGLFMDTVVLSLLDDLSHANNITQILHVELDRVLVACYPLGNIGGNTCLALCIGDLQIDNPLACYNHYDFPVVLMCHESVKPLETEITAGLAVAELHAILRVSSVVHMQFVLTSDAHSGLVISSLDVGTKSLTVYIEDTFVYRLMKECMSYLPTHLSMLQDSQAEPRIVPATVLAVAQVQQNPLRIEHICLQPATLLLTVHASIKMFLSADHAPLSFASFERRGLVTSTGQLAHSLAMHYVTSAIFRAGMVVGSLDIFGSPTGLVRSVGLGVTDLVRLPYRGLTQSPLAFMTGVCSGVTSLVRNVTTGMVTSVTNFASSISRNMDRLSLDVEYRERQEETRRQQPTSFSSGLRQGLTGFGLSLLGGVAGLVDQPLQTVLEQQEEQGKSVARRAGSLVAGMGKGLVGVITKPIGGAAEFVSQTGCGLLEGTGLRQKMTPRCQPSILQRSAVSAGWLKYSMKILPDTQLLLAVTASQYDLLETPAAVVLLLTRDMVVVVSCEDDAQQQAFALSQLECSCSYPNVLDLTLGDTVGHGNAQGDQANRDRVAAFINSSRVLTQSGSMLEQTPQFLQHSSREGHSGHHSLTNTTLTDQDKLYADLSLTLPHQPWRLSGNTTNQAGQCPSYEFRMDPHWCQLFISVFSLAKHNLNGRGFPV